MNVRRPGTTLTRTWLCGPLAALTLAACTPALPDHRPAPDSPLPPGITPVCDNTQPGPAEPPAGAIMVNPSVAGDLSTKTDANPAGTTFWLAPGTHTLGTDEFAQVIPEDGNIYLGAPGAILDGQGLNRYAFTQRASDVTIKYLTITGFEAPANEGIVNHDSGNRWIIAHNTIENNGGAALMAGSGQVVRGNCLRNNGQYAMNAYQAGNQVHDLLVVGNEIVGNNADDLEAKLGGCGCTGGIKFWSVNGATVKHNWIHHNHGAALWGDNNNNNFLIADNVIAHNDGEAIFYETSYNAVIRDNVIRGNAIVEGQEFASRDDNFPVAAIYISESGGEPRIPARTSRIEIYDNVLTNNWSGITLWENADRFCNSPANPTDDCTLLIDNLDRCSLPTITSPPAYDDCRWKTKRVDIHDNKFVFDPAEIGCSSDLCGRMAIIANYGTYPDWSPYEENVIREAITFQQQNRWHDNRYVGPWSFMAYDRSRVLTSVEWRAAPYRQDRTSTFE